MRNETSVVLWKEVYEIAELVGKQFNLRYHSIVPETRKRVRFYGECRPCNRCWGSERFSDANCKQKNISIRIHQLNSNRPLARSTIVDTLAHELAHLRVWAHNAEHTALTAEIKEFIVQAGYKVR